MFGGGSVCAFLGIILLNTGERKARKRRRRRCHREGCGGSQPVFHLRVARHGLPRWTTRRSSCGWSTPMSAPSAPPSPPCAPPSGCLEPSESPRQRAAERSRRARGRPPRRSPATRRPPASLAADAAAPRGHRRTSSGTYLDPAGLRDDAATAAARALAAAIETEEASRLRAQNVALAYDDTDEEEAARGKYSQAAHESHARLTTASSTPAAAAADEDPEGRRRPCTRRRRTSRAGTSTRWSGGGRAAVGVRRPAAATAPPPSLSALPSHRLPLPPSATQASSPASASTRSCRST